MILDAVARDLGVRDKRVHIYLLAGITYVGLTPQDFSYQERAFSKATSPLSGCFPCEHNAPDSYQKRPLPHTLEYAFAPQPDDVSKARKSIPMMNVLIGDIGTRPLPLEFDAVEW